MIVNVDVASKAYKIVKKRPLRPLTYVIENKEETLIRTIIIKG
jgi:hypothetical protein